MGLLEELAIIAIDPYRAVDLMGKRRLTFKNPETIDKARKLLKKYLSEHKSKRSTILDYLYNWKNVKTQAQNLEGGEEYSIQRK